ncbi:MAG: riboflavin synthase [Chloroflexota bacterium]
MFTGIVEAKGTVVDVSRLSRGMRLAVDLAELDGLRPGDSLAVNGVCLTITGLQSAVASMDVVLETLRRTTLKDLRPGEPVNLERPARPTSLLGGHVVQGHVDAVGRVMARRPHGEGILLEVAAPADVMRYVVPKGSIAVDGVSLTVVSETPGGRGFVVALIPHTLAATTLGRRMVGAPVNLEADVLGKYVERLLASAQGDAAARRRPWPWE